MGYGGALTLVNGSPFDWTLASQHAYQMDSWNWPTISTGKASRVYVEFGTKGNTRDDAGEAYYSIAGTSNKFTVLARKPTDYKLTISLDSMSMKQSPQGSNIDLGFRHDATVNWIMSTDEAGQWWSNSGTYTDWMQQSMGSLANRTLKQICMPGSHDAGMSTFRPGTVGANMANTQTQYLDFYQQLVAGSRFFDLRPVISSGQWVAGHYSALRNDVEDIWLGGNGQSIADIIKQVNDFTAQYKELVIINLSHTLDTDNRYKDLSQDQWNSLFDTLKGLNSRYTVRNPGNTDFSNSVLGEFITDRASVFIVAQLPNGISLGDYANEGFFSSENFPFFDSYSNSNKLPNMKSDQLAKLKANRNLVSDASTRKDKFHLLSWTLTQQPEDVLNMDRAIMNLAASAFDELVSEAWNAFTPESFPNVLFVDALGIRDKSVVFPFDKPRNVAVNNDITALAIAVNNGMAGRNRYITGR
ncbi:PLC-like phosphodiesterase [Cucurbitaria berberidis CBS 394.84]|uniref:PLC-like phosphodiesterase n=1 Tax=Cucurbitaria berberidis CBS 394.84 TaxID=1168544 RepID=A0A9P4GBX8_9PLEO|nr:PLC-like phosphodiesterase [Cucurbitaria berberidis CBS 394.84]KAF1842531.1 PLC-like phosphodiesterase [Cucurbitaria berberidis CBS 394.84]